MMRFKYVLLAAAAALALPVAAQAQILRGPRCGGLFGGRLGGGIGFGGGNVGGGNLGGKANAFFGAISDAIASSPGPVWPEKKDKGGLGFFQPPFQASPWYVYWPYDQHFQLPAPINAPYFAPQLYAHPSMNQYFPPGHGAGMPPVAPPHPAPPGTPVLPPPKK